MPSPPLIKSYWYRKACRKETVMELFAPRYRYCTKSILHNLSLVKSKTTLKKKAWIGHGPTWRLDGDYQTLSSVEILEPPAQGATDAAWTQRELLALNVGRSGCCGCVLGNGRFAVLGG